MADRNSDLSQIAVNANNIPDGSWNRITKNFLITIYKKNMLQLQIVSSVDSVDCGVRLFGWCRGPSCQKYARLRTFVVVLAIAGIIQGTCETYFRVSAKEVAIENGYNPLIVGKYPELYIWKRVMTHSSSNYSLKIFSGIMISAIINLPIKVIIVFLSIWQIWQRKQLLYGFHLRVITKCNISDTIAQFDLNAYRISL